MKVMRKSSESACVVLPPKLFRIMEKPVHEFCEHTGVLPSHGPKMGICHLLLIKTACLWQVGHDKCLGVYSHNNYGEPISALLLFLQKYFCKL
ncbi:hypothetical protein HAX54_048701 [Datura stramonium]|uniref:Uncharacterized protein n=1 Tax=Datura stramonium TaxID=4076 RepID=A0ABS8SU76_DATST|nr:hypothetical protein [Datura stramonium]